MLFPSRPIITCFPPPSFPFRFSTVPIESNCRSIRHACSRQPDHRRTRQVSVIICVIATEVSYPHPLFYRSISSTHSQPSIRPSDPWLLHVCFIACSRLSLPPTPLCFSADRVKMFSQLSLPSPGRNLHQRQGFSSPFLHRQQPTFSNILFFLYLHMFSNILFYPLYARFNLTSTFIAILFLLLSVCVFCFRFPQRLRHPGTLKSQLLIGITQKMNRNEKLSTSLRLSRCVSLSLCVLGSVAMREQ
jgi:hypothetical protein